MLLASAVPVNVGVVILVMLSVLETPLSDATTRSGRLGAATFLSMVICKTAEAALTLPARSVALAVILRAPAARAEVVMLQLPSAAAMPVPTLVVPLNTVTVLPASQSL